MNFTKYPNCRFLSLAFIASFLLLSSIWSSAAAQGVPRNQPNIVLIIVDTLRADKLGIYNPSLPVSREFDRLADKGVIFDFTIAQSSWTRSSLASMLTSKYPRSLGVIKEKWDPLPQEVLTLAEALSASGYQTIGLTANPQLNKSFGFAQGFDIYRDSQVLFGWMKPEEGKVAASSKYRVASAGEVFADADKLLEEAEKDKRPLYLQFLLMDVHAHEKVKDDAIDADLRKLPEAPYLQTVRNVSGEIAKFIERFSKRERFKNTWFIVTSDHGEGLSDHPDVERAKGHGNTLYQSVLHVPLVFLKSGNIEIKPQRVSELTALLDVFPTVLGLAGAKAPPGLGGADLSKVLLGGAFEIRRDYVFSETAWRKVEKDAAISKNWIFVRNKDDWKGTNPEELQRVGSVSNGAKTDQKGTFPQPAAAHKAALIEWDKSHPLPVGYLQQREKQAKLWSETGDSADQGGKGTAPSKEEIEQLRSLGYL